MRMRVAWEQPTTLPAGEGLVQLPHFAEGWLSDPSWLDANGQSHKPMSVSLRHDDEQDLLTYRWLVDKALVALTTRRYLIHARHPHKSMFAATDARMNAGEQSHWDRLAVIEVVTQWGSPERPPVWRQRGSELGAAVSRLYELHGQIADWLHAAEGSV